MAWRRIVTAHLLIGGERITTASGGDCQRMMASRHRAAGRRCAALPVRSGIEPAVTTSGWQAHKGLHGYKCAAGGHCRRVIWADRPSPTWCTSLDRRTPAPSGGTTRVPPSFATPTALMLNGSCGARQLHRCKRFLSAPAHWSRVRSDVNLIRSQPWWVAIAPWNGALAMARLSVAPARWPAGNAVVFKPSELAASRCAR